MKKILLFLALAAVAVHGATVKVATRDWVKSYVSEMLTAKATVMTNVTTISGSVVTNYTFSSPFYSEDAPDVKGIALTVSYNIVPTNSILAAMPPVPPVPVRFTFWDMLFPRAFAEMVPWDDDGYQIQLQLYNIEIVVQDNSKFRFHFYEPEVYGYQEKIPLVPEGQDHVCDIPDGSDCVCLDAKSIAEAGKLEYPENYTYATADDLYGPKGNIRNWVDFERWQGVKRNSFGKIKYCYVIGPMDDESYVDVNLEDVGRSEAWKEAILGAFIEWNEHLDKCRKAYEKQHLCLKVIPQHDWGETAPTGNYRYGEEETIQFCKRNASHVQTSWRAHNHDGHWGDWLYQTVNGMNVKIRYCTKCGMEDGPYPADAGPLTCSGDSHVPLSMVATNGVTRCGCVCGEVDPENFKDEQFHSWAANANPACICRCGHYHRGVAPSAYDVNSGTKCPDICTHCDRRHSQNGIDVPAAGPESHTPRTGGHCGCRCGKFTHNHHDPEHAKFHIRKAGDCCCLGADGNGGDWHFPCAKSSCTKICLYDYNGHGPHLAVSSKVYTGDHPLQVASPKDHTRNENGCGCRCGDMDSSNRDEWNGVEDLHKWQSGHCICVCGMSPKHNPISRQPCDNICRGYEATHQREIGQKQCPLTVDGFRVGTHIKYSHTPKFAGCGCACGDFGKDDYSGTGEKDAMFHGGTGVPACWCTCGKDGPNAWHTFATNNPCEKICYTCGTIKTRGKKHCTEVVAADPSKDHTAVTNRCGCACNDAKSLLYKKYHPIEYGHCGCIQCTRFNYRNHLTVPHVTQDNETGVGPSFTCGTCGNEIGRVKHTVVCKTNPDGCWMCPYVYYSESGHAPDCTAAPTPPSEQDEEDETPTDAPPDVELRKSCNAVLRDGGICGVMLNEDESCPNEINHDPSQSIDDGGTNDTGNTGSGTIGPKNPLEF